MATMPGSRGTAARKGRHGKGIRGRHRDEGHAVKGEASTRPGGGGLDTRVVGGGSSGAQLPEPPRTGDVRKTSGSCAPPHMGSVGKRDNGLLTRFRWVVVPQPAPRKSRVIVKEPVMLDVIWLLGVIALFILLALCVRGVDAL